MKLANDIARCDGVGSMEDGVQGWREGCETCLRRTAPRPERVWMIAPPPIIAFECEFLRLQAFQRRVAIYRLGRIQLGNEPRSTRWDRF